eukprot:16077279-Heterocapsa_arctica.AAC.1
MGGGYAVENPKRWAGEASLFVMNEIVALVGSSGADTVDLDQCCYGAVATKPTTLLYKGAAFGDLVRRRDHPLQRWTKADGTTYWAAHESLIGRRLAS